MAPKENGISSPLRMMLRFNERIFSSIFSPSRNSEEFPISDAAIRVRKNGMKGMEDSVNIKLFRLQLIGNKGDTTYINLEELKKLPRTEVVFDFKCIEGWSQVTRWAGVKFSDFAKYYHAGTRDGSVIPDKPGDSWYKYAGFQTPNGKYYVGIDMPSVMHNQTILCYEMNGKPLPLPDGAPLRLIIPVKYGVKHLKRIGRIYFSDDPPPDYWAKYGYDYFAGL